MAKKPDGDKVAALRRMREANHAGRATKETEAEHVEAAKRALTKKNQEDDTMMFILYAATIAIFIAFGWGAVSIWMSDTDDGTYKDGWTDHK